MSLDSTVMSTSQILSEPSKKDKWYSKFMPASKKDKPEKKEKESKKKDKWYKKNKKIAVLAE